MTITSALVLLAVIWFMTLFVVLPIGLRTHGDEGVNTSDNPAYAPSNLRMKRKFAVVTGITLALWVPLCLLIMSGWIGIADIDWRGTLGQ